MGPLFLFNWGTKNLSFILGKALLLNKKEDINGQVQRGHV